MSSALFPNVPIAPGVPAVLRRVGTIETQVNSVVSAISSFLGQKPKWGLFTPQGQPFFDFDSVLEFEPSKEYEISDFPIEQGQFGSSSKVELPLRARLVISCGGSQSRRSTFLAAIEAATASLKLATITTPERSYQNVNLVRYDLQRTAQNGVTLLIVGLFLEQVRNTAVVTTPVTATPAGATQVSGGNVQAIDGDPTGLSISSNTGAEAFLGSDGLNGPVPAGLLARDGSPYAAAIDAGEAYSPLAAEGAFIQ